MKQEQQAQAQRLYFQTDLSKTRIAQEIGITRGTVHQWIRENHWQQLKRSASVMPSLIAENCYLIMSQLTVHILSPEREGKPATSREINDLNKLSVTINRLKKRSTLNESMEMFAYFMEGLCVTDPELAQAIEPHISAYITGRAAAYSAQATPATAPAHGEEASPAFSTGFVSKPTPEELAEEARLDAEDLRAWTAAGHPIMDKINKPDPFLGKTDVPASEIKGNRAFRRKQAQAARKAA